MVMGTRRLHVPVVCSESGPRVDTCFKVQGAGLRVQGAGYRVQGAGFRVQGLWCRVPVVSSESGPSVDTCCTATCPLSVVQIGSVTLHRRN